MRRSLAALALGVGLLGAHAAQAGTLVYAELTIAIDALPQSAFTASGLLGGSAGGTGSGATWSVGAGAAPGGTLTMTIPSSAAPPITQVQFILNGNPGAGAFSASSPASMAITGVAVFKRDLGAHTLLGVPLVFGQATTVQPPVVIGVGITGHAHPWTTQTTTITSTYLNGTGARTAMGSNGLVNGGGTVVLVSALNVLTNVGGQLPIFAFLTLTYLPDVPEPGALLLLGSGVAGLAALGRRKLRR